MTFQMDAHKYNKHTMKGVFRKIYPVIAEQVVDRTGIRSGLCIDLGGGPGMLGICMAKASDLRVTIIDPLLDCVTLARENIVEHGVEQQVFAKRGIAEALDFADDSVDLVVSRGSIYFWQDQRAGLSEVFRVLRPGGWGYIGGGFGNKALHDEVTAAMAKDANWSTKRGERGRKHPPEHFATLLQELAIIGSVERDDRGTWIIFQKPEQSQ